MNRKISDLMDHIGETNVELDMLTPLSSQRIKEITMKKVKKNNSVRRFGVRLLIAAAIISMMAVTAFAAENVFQAGDWFRGLFNDEISDGQVEVINELGADFAPQTITSEGTTITLSAAYGDENVLFMYFRVVAPEGTVLPDGITYDFYDYNTQNWNVLELPEGVDYAKHGYSLDIEPLADADPSDNHKDFLVKIESQSGNGIRFNDGKSKLYHITGIYEQVTDVDGDEDAYVPLATGDFTFDVGLCNAAEMIELDVGGLTYGGDKTRTWTHDSPCIESCSEELTGETDPVSGLPIHSESWTYSVTAKSLRITQISAEWECEYTCDYGFIYGLDFVVVMKGGSRIEALSGIGNLDGGTWSKGTAVFTEPLDLEQVDYILIGDEELGQTYKVFLPDAAE